MNYEHRAAAIRDYTSGILRAAHAYREMTTCVCGNPVNPLPSRRRATCDACTDSNARAVKRAADQQRYRDRARATKEQR